MASLYLVGADKAALDQWELRLLRPAPIGSQVGAREKWKTFWVSKIGETTSPQEEAWVDCKSYETRPKERIFIKY